MLLAALNRASEAQCTIYDEKSSPITALRKGVAESSLFGVTVTRLAVNQIQLNCTASAFALTVFAHERGSIRIDEVISIHAMNSKQAASQGDTQDT